jgi:uncharacterized membrane protein YbhN (UPF0104 family)
MWDRGVKTTDFWPPPKIAVLQGLIGCIAGIANSIKQGHIRAQYLDCCETYQSGGYLSLFWLILAFFCYFWQILGV